MPRSTSRFDPEAGQRLDDAMARKAISPQRLAREAGVSLKSLGRWLKGEPIQRENAYAVAKVLGIDPWVIWLDFAPTGAATELLTDDDAEPVLSVSDHGITDVFLSRAELTANYPPAGILAEATRLQVMGLSLNQIAQSVTDRQLRAAVGRGTQLQCLFLEPYSRYTSDREAEEGHTANLLSQLTVTNIDTLKRARRHLPADTAHQLQLRTYHAPLRFHIMIIDESVAIAQFYLPAARGTESPALVLRPTTTPPDLFSEFTTVFNDAWATAKEV
jgi:lambda repressor-like predicted transcriptional regulator